MTGVNLSDAAVQERRAGLRWAWFEALFAHVLRPLAQRDKHPESFYRQLRLLAIDGSQWSLRNTQELRAQGWPSSANQKDQNGAFPKWGTAVLLEVGTHQPLGAACCQPQIEPSEGELTLARRVLAAIPCDEDTLLLLDRCYGSPTFINEVLRVAGARCAVLVRIKSNLKVKAPQPLADGSVLIEVHSREERAKDGARLRLREIRGKVWRESSHASPSDGAPATEVRLWTTLLDEQAYPAEELLKLYAQRWEQELFFRELKQHTGREQLLRAGTVQGAQAEFGVLLMAASLLARERLEAARKVDVPPVRISLSKISRALEVLLPVLAAAREVVTEKQCEQIAEKFLAQTAREAKLPPRRGRSCQRGLRKPASAWPRIRTREYATGVCVAEVLATLFP